MDCKKLETPTMILGNIATFVAVAGPIFFADPWGVAPKYYSVLLALSLVLMLLRGILVRAFPKVKAFARPKKHGGDFKILEFFYRGGMPSGHLGTVALFCTLLFIAYPTVVTLIIGLAAMLVVALYRYCNEFHTIPQLLAGAASGVVTAAATSSWILQ